MNQAQIKELRRIIWDLYSIDGTTLSVEGDLALRDGIEDLEALMHQAEAAYALQPELEGLEGVEG